MTGLLAAVSIPTSTNKYQQILDIRYQYQSNHCCSQAVFMLWSSLSLESYWVSPD